MTLTVLQPPGWPRPSGYANGIRGEGRMVFVAGQIGWDADRLLARDFVAQCGQALRNVLAVLAEAGAGPGDVARMTWYVTDIAAFRTSGAALGVVWRETMGRHFPAMSVVGVAALVEPAALVEIEATAVVSARPESATGSLAGRTADGHGISGAQRDAAVMAGSRAAPGRRRGRPVLAAAVIGLGVGVAAAAFAWTGGWLTPQRLTPARMVAALSDRGGNPLGHRRNHAKGICFTGEFEANGAGVRLSTAPMLVAGHYPVIGRFAIATGNPDAPDATARVRSMAIRVVAPDGEEWRSGMNDMPVFVVATPQAFYQLTLAQRIDPATGKPDPAAVQHFLAAHPESAGFVAWAKTAPWTASFVDQTYNSLDAFRFIDAGGRSHLVRWSMQATLPPVVVPRASLAGLGPDFLERDLMQRVAQGKLRWHLVVTLAEPGDPSNDATRAWPADRPQVDIGTLVVQQAENEADGPCRDYNFDPTILPTGIRPSDDPLLAARSAAYARSFDLRSAEAAAYKRTPPQPGGAQ